MTDAQRKLMQHPIIKGSVLFVMFLVTTKNLVAAIGLVFLYYFIIGVLLNENNKYNVFSRSWLIEHGFAKTETEGFTGSSLVERYKTNLRELLVD
jgi:hypothetical protein